VVIGSITVVVGSLFSETFKIPHQYFFPDSSVSIPHGPSLLTSDIGVSS